MANRKNSSDTVVGIVQLPRKLAHLATRIARNDPGDLGLRLAQQIESCLLANQQRTLDTALSLAIAEEGGYEVLDDAICEREANLIRPDPKTGQLMRIALFGIPIMFGDIIHTALDFPERLPALGAIVDLVKSQGADPANTLIAPTLYDPELLSEVSACSIYRLLHELAPAHLVARDELLAPEVTFSSESLHLKGPAYTQVERILVGVSIQPEGTPAFFETDQVVSDEAQEGAADALETMLGMQAGIMGASSVGSAIQFLLDTRPSRRLMAQLSFALSQLQVQPAEVEALIAVEGGPGEGGAPEFRIHNGQDEVEIPVELTGLEVLLRRKSDGVNLTREMVELTPENELEAVMEGVTVMLASLGIDMAAEHAGP